METISRSLLTFLLNSLWQIPLAALVAALACRMLRRGPASHRHAVWVAALVAAILLPLASVRTGQSTPGPQFAASLADGAGGGRRGAAGCRGGSADAGAGCQNRLLGGNYGERPDGRLPAVCPLPLRTAGVGVHAHRADPQRGTVHGNSGSARPGVDALPGGLRAERRAAAGFRASIGPG